ncbi:hypothetical protein JCM8547_001119 [Rhodosporidiobolus lusitaniae]
MAPTELISQLQDADLIPNQIPQTLAQTLKGPVKVHYAGTTASLGEFVEREQTLTEPDLEFADADPSATYTIIMSDPDLFVKNDPVSKHVRHWIRSSASFDETSKRMMANVNPPVLNDYVPCSPALGTGKHRYIFFVAKEPAGYVPKKDAKWGPLDKPNSDLKDRLAFLTADYILEEGLTLEGVGWMEVASTAASTKDNLVLSAKAIKNKITGQ